MLTEEYLMTFVPERFLCDERYRSGHIHILAPAEGTRILGLHTPEMKLIARQLVKSGDWREQIELWKSHFPLTGADGLTHEERMVWGLTIDYVKVPLDERLAMIDSYIPAVDNWALCDNLCCNSKWVRREDRQRIWRFLKDLIDSTEEFRSRVGLILSLAHFLDPDNLPRTLEYVAGRAYKDSDPYYIRMGAAWLFAEALCKQYDTALDYIREGRLSRWIHNKAIQKARESWRINHEQKQELSGYYIRSNQSTR